MVSENLKAWFKSVKAEIIKLENLKTYIIMELLKGKTVIGFKQLFKLKLIININFIKFNQIINKEKIKKYKARFIV